MLWPLSYQRAIQLDERHAAAMVHERNFDETIPASRRPEQWHRLYAGCVYIIHCTCKAGRAILKTRRVLSKLCCCDSTSASLPCKYAETSSPSEIREANLWRVFACAGIGSYAAVGCVDRDSGMPFWDSFLPALGCHDEFTKSSWGSSLDFWVRKCKVPKYKACVRTIIRHAWQIVGLALARGKQ